MPNDCINRITIYADTATIQRIAAADYDILSLVPPLPEDTPEARADAYGSDRFYDYEQIHIGPEGAMLRFTTAWAPPLKFLHTLAETEKGVVFMKSDWDVEDGAAGIWVAERRAGSDELLVQSMNWDEGCLEERAHRFGPPKK